MIMPFLVRWASWSLVMAISAMALRTTAQPVLSPGHQDAPTESVRDAPSSQRFGAKKFSLSDLCLSPSHDLIERFQDFSEITIEHCALPLMHTLPARSVSPTGIIFIGSIIPTKGLHVLLRALALLDEPPQLTHYWRPICHRVD